MSDEIEIGGRRFRPIERSTIERDFWLMARIRAAGLDEPKKAESESADGFAIRLLHVLLASGRAFEILGGLFSPADAADEDWTPAAAADTAAFLRRQTEPEAKQAIQAALVSALIGFFGQGLGSSLPSPAYSGAGPAAGGSEPGQGKISATGASLSASSPAGIRGAIERWFGGRSMRLSGATSAV